MAMSIILVEMALKCFFFVKSKDKDKATYIANLMSHSANITSAISYDKKKKNQNQNTLFPSQIVVLMCPLLTHCC